MLWCLLNSGEKLAVPRELSSETLRAVKSQLERRAAKSSTSIQWLSRALLFSCIPLIVDTNPHPRIRNSRLAPHALHHALAVARARRPRVDRLGLRRSVRAEGRDSSRAHEPFERAGMSILWAQASTLARARLSALRCPSSPRPTSHSLIRLSKLLLGSCKIAALLDLDGNRESWVRPPLGSYMTFCRDALLSK